GEAHEEHRGAPSSEQSTHDFETSRGDLRRATLPVSFDEFERRAREAVAGGERRLVPVWQDTLLDVDTPVSAFAKLRRDPFAFLLESAPAGGETWARYTFLGTEPRSAWRLMDGVVQDWTPERGWHGDRRPDDPL